MLCLKMEDGERVNFATVWGSRRELIPQGGAQPKVGAVLPIQEDRKAALWRWKKTNILGNLKYFRQLWIKSELEMLRKEDNAVTS